MMKHIVESSEGNGITDLGAWFCDRRDFWGTPKQLCLCAKCGKHEIKRHDEPRHYGGLLTPTMHMICDDCFASLPDNGDRRE